MLQCPGQAGVSEVGGGSKEGMQGLVSSPLPHDKDGMEWGVLKPKAGTLLWCAIFKPLLFLAVVLSSSGRGREMYHFKIRCT